jgi:hypothetical protein
MKRQNIYHEREEIYRQKIFNNFNFLNIEMPKYHQSYYDIIINNKKIQEKVAGMRTNNIYSCSLYRSNGYKKFQSYKLGMNDYYWIHIENTDIFYIFPEKILKEYDLIDNNKKYNSIYLNLNKNDWYNEYQYNYNNIDKKYFIKLFN